MAMDRTMYAEKQVFDFLQGVSDEKKRRDSLAVLELMREVTGEEPRMWGESIVGFGSCRSRYATGTEGEWFLTGFSPRQKCLTLYINPGFGRYQDLVRRLGRCRTARACLHIRRLEDVDREVLRELVRRSTEEMRRGRGVA